MCGLGGELAQRVSCQKQQKMGLLVSSLLPVQGCLEPSQLVLQLLDSYSSQWLKVRWALSISFQFLETIQG